MQGKPFLDRPMSIALDAVRFISALIVLLRHASLEQFYQGYTPFTDRMSHNSVVVFFVLSGLVIAASVADRRTSLAKFAISRAARIMVVAVPAVILACLTFVLGRAMQAPLAASDWSLVTTAGVSALTFTSQSPIGTGMVGNPAYWSLCYEVWYYALFGAAVFMSGRARWIALAVMAALAGWQVLLLFPLWLAGCWLYRAEWPAKLTQQRGWLILLACYVVMLWVATWDMQVLFGLRDLLPFDLGMSEWIVSDIVVTAVTVAALGAIWPIAQAHAALLERAARPLSFAAGFSFSLYLFHYPLLFLLDYAGISAGTSAIGYGLIVLLILALCAGIAQLTERQTPHVRRWLTGLQARFALQRQPA